MIKRLTAFFLTISLVLSMSSLVFSADASDITLNYLLTCNGKHSETVPTGTEIVVEYAIKNITNEDDFTVYTIQNEIYYDHSFFEFVDNSFDMKISSLQTSVKSSEGENHKLIKEIYINDSTTQQYLNHQVVGTFKLRVIATSGSSTIKSTEIIAYEDGNTKYGVSNQLGNLTITVGDGTSSPTMFTLTFNTNGGTAIDTLTSAEGTVVDLTQHPTPTKTGYTFDGWYSDAGLTNKVTSVTLDGNKTVYAKWKATSTEGGGIGGGTVATKKYTLTFSTDGGSKVDSLEAKEGTKVSLDKYVSEKSGYKFDGWYSDKELTKKVTEITLNKDMTVYAKWVVSEDEPIVVKPNYKPGILTDEHYAYIVGREGKMIEPESDITRAEVATIIYRLLDKDERNKAKTKENVFTDVNEDDWFNTAVSTLASLELVNGRTTDTFAPNAFITRAEIATIFARMVAVKYDDKALFSDVSGHWAESYINEAASLGWIVGYNGLFRPDDNITRAEVMTLVNRVLNREPESIDDLLEGMAKWTDNADTSAWYYMAVQEATNSHEYKMKSDGVHEKWTALTENPNWSELER